MHTLLAHRCHEGTEHAGNFARVASSGYELLITLTGHKISKVGQELVLPVYSIYDMIYLITAIGLTPGGSRAVHITHCT